MNKNGHTETEILKLIADGYFHGVEDGIIICTNPNFKEDDGSDPFIVYDPNDWTFEPLDD